MISALRRWTLIAIGLILFGCCPRTSALTGEAVVFHCPTACKVYVDGELLQSLPNGGVKQSVMVTGHTSTILITRPGKPDWIRRITPRSALSINPEESNPTVIPDDNSDASPLQVPKNSSDNPIPATSSSETPRANHQEVNVPWLNGLFTLPRSADTKRLQIKGGSRSCPVDIDMYLSLSGGDHFLDIEYKQDMDAMEPVYEDAAAGREENEWCRDHHDDPVFNQNWDFETPITVAQLTDDSFTFKAELSTCHASNSSTKPCKLPPGIAQITGQVRRNGSGLTVEFDDPLKASFDLEKYHHEE